MSEAALSDVTFALPRWVYLPGLGEEPDREALDAAKCFVPAWFDGFVPVDDPGFRYGLALHDACFFWEAHEIWEAVWMAAPMNGRDRIALRALIQIANAGLKSRMERPRAAVRLIREADSLLAELVSRGPAAETSSVAAKLRTERLRDELRHRAEGGFVILTEFVTSERCIKMHELAAESWTT